MNSPSLQTPDNEITRLRNAISAGGCQTSVPGSEGYARVTRIWNGSVNCAPALIAHCLTADDVRLSVTAARTHGCPISVRGGGHDWAGRGLVHGGLVIDLSGMRQIEVNAQAQEATIAGGVLAADISAAVLTSGLSVVTGYGGAVGMAGLLLGGGYGPLMTRFGLASDSLLSADVVLADGRLVTADASQNTALFWALRGGGGNFGVVVSMRIRLHAAGTILSGRILFPWSDAEAVLRGYAQLMFAAPDELALAVAMAVGPDGKPVIVLLPAWTGTPGQGQQIIADLNGLGTPILSKIEPMTVSGILGLYDAQVVDGRQNTVETRWLAELSAEAIAELIAAYDSRTSRLSTVVIHHFHGAGARVSPESSAFGVRQEHFTVLIYSTWEQGTERDSIEHRKWASTLSSRLAPLALPGGYANLLAADADEQIADAYGNNASRLCDAKRQYDPDGVFSSAIPLPLRGT